MKLATMINRQPLWYPADGAGDPPAGDPPATPPAGDPPAGDPPATPPAGETKLWWESDGYKASSDWMGNKGLQVEDQNDATSKAIEGWRNAEARLGKPAESIMDRPTKDQSTAEFMRANAELFGLPDKVEGYEMPNLNLPEGMQVDEDLMNGARQIAFDESLPPVALEKVIGLYVGKMTKLYEEPADELKKSNDEMRSTLQKGWGDQTDAKIDRAKSAFQFLAEKAGMDEDEQLNAAKAMSKEHGDPMVLKMFDGLASMMGEDKLEGLGSGGGFTTTPAEAKAKIAAMKAPDSEYNQAVKVKDTKKILELEKELSRLNKIRAGG